jgi:hypothetical protein
MGEIGKRLRPWAKLKAPEFVSKLNGCDMGLSENV